MDQINCDIELRADDSRASPGRVIGTLIEYGIQARDRQERFLDGSLSWPDGGIVLSEQHNRQAPILRFTPKLEGSKLTIDALLPDSTRGRDAAVSIREGLFTGLSVEFVSKQEARRGGVREIARAQLVGAGLVDSPSYAGSSVSLRWKADRRRLWL